MTVIDSTWDARLQRAAAAYPSTTLDLTLDDTTKVVNGEELLVKVLREVLAVDHVKIRRGQRPLPDVDEGRQLLRELTGQDYTVEPFPEAFRALIGVRSFENVRRRTGLSKANISRLLNRQKEPRTDEMAAIAEGFGKRPMYFAEYRAAMFAALVREHLTADPDRSAVLAHQLMGR